MEVVTRLALYLGGLVVALVTGWALGQATAVLVPDLIVPGHEPVHVHSAALPLPTPYEEAR